MSGRLAERSWRDLADGPVWLLVPVGSVEQHGPHLPLRTDTVIAEAVAGEVAASLDGAGRTVCVSPAVEYGAAGEHQAFPGTMSIGQAALRLLLLELGRSACTWAARVALVNGHGGNVEALASAVVQLRREGREVGWTACAEPGWDAHAGDAETSMMLALDPASVAGEREAGVLMPVGELMGDLRERGVRAVSPTGVLGDPTAASAERGRVMLAALAERVAGEVTRMACDERGRLR